MVEFTLSSAKESILSMPKDGNDTEKCGLPPSFILSLLKSRNVHSVGSLCFDIRILIIRACLGFRY